MTVLPPRTLASPWAPLRAAFERFATGTPSFALPVAPALALVAEERSGGLMNLPAPFLAALLGALLLSMSWHEAAHAWVADRLGDPTARSLGRVTLNPIRHLDLFLSVLLPAMLIMARSPFVIGGGKPVPINVANFRHRARDFMLVALAGPGSNVLLALLCGLIFVLCSGVGLVPVEWIANPYGEPTPLPPSLNLLDTGMSDSPWIFALQIGVLINIGLALFNLMPIPPLDGSRLVGWLLPEPLQPHWYALDRLSLLLIVVVFFVLGGITWVQIAFLHAFRAYARFVDELAWAVTGY